MSSKSESQTRKPNNNPFIRNQINVSIFQGLSPEAARRTAIELYRKIRPIKRLHGMFGLTTSRGVTSR